MRSPPPDLVGPQLREALDKLLRPRPLGGCWSCGRLDCHEPDGESCRAYVASVEIVDEEIPF
jgi:hypothetical protein